MPPSLSHQLLRGALLTPLVIGCSDSGVAESGDSETIHITSATVTDTTSSGPTTTPTSSTDPSETDSSTGPTPPCKEGTVMCEDPDKRQECRGGKWVDVPCPEGSGCDVFGVCLPCVCTESECLDAGTLNVCDCIEFTPQPCGPTAACDTLDGQLDCHAIVCSPGAAQCEGAGSVLACNAAGTAFLPPTDCEPDELCSFGECLPACEAVATDDSSIGCDFWAVDMANVPPRDAYVFGVALSNPNPTLAVDVQIYDRKDGADQLVAEGTIGPRDVEVFALSGTSNGDTGFYPGDAGFLGTGIAKGRAFHIISKLPIVATQFNPLGGAKAFTTDASLLLPTHALGKSYYHLAWEKGLGAGSSLVIVATEDNTSVTIHSTVDTLPGENGMPALAAGQEVTIPGLMANDYVQVSSAGQDLSSTKITATAPIAVFGGHSCGHVPSVDIDFCDHLEEQIFPIDTWGVHYVAARALPRNKEPMLWRVLAAKDGTIVDFKPAVSLGDSAKLDAGEFVQFTADGDFEITTNKTKDHPVLVAGYMYGCKATQKPECPGDPSMVLAVPVEQWLADYVFLVDFSYTTDNVKLVRTKGKQVALGCLDTITEWTAVNDAYESATVNINPGVAACKPGTNTATGEAPFSIMVVGEAASTSYAYPGGLGLKPINPQ